MKLNRRGTETNDLRRIQRMDVLVIVYCDEKINVTHMNVVEEIAVTDCFSGRLNLPIAHRVNFSNSFIWKKRRQFFDVKSNWRLKLNQYRSNNHGKRKTVEFKLMYAFSCSLNTTLQNSIFATVS